jgi:hypothetical protein
LPCSHAIEFRNLLMAVPTSLPQRLGLSNERPCTNTKTLPARGIPRARCPPRVLYDFFKKILTTMSRPIARAKSFLTETQSCKKLRRRPAWGVVLLFVRSS